MNSHQRRVAWRALLRTTVIIVGGRIPGRRSGAQLAYLKRKMTKPRRVRPTHIGMDFGTHGVAVEAIRTVDGVLHIVKETRLS